MTRFLIGLCFLPSAASLLAAAFESLAGLAAGGHLAQRFLAGMAVALAFWCLECFGMAMGFGPFRWVAGLSRRSYVFGHEMTHALAAWSIGAKVIEFKVGESSGHVRVSRLNAFVSLAPYFVPVFALAVIAGYRVFLWFHPGKGHLVFMGLLGAALGFHLIKTFEAVWDLQQPDLRAAGGNLFSLSCILAANGILILLLAKAFFPRRVQFQASLLQAAVWSGSFWRWAYFLTRRTGAFLAALPAAHRLPR